VTNYIVAIEILKHTHRWAWTS